MTTTNKKKKNKLAETKRLFIESWLSSLPRPDKVTLRALEKAFSSMGFEDFTMIQNALQANNQSELVDAVSDVLEKEFFPALKQDLVNQIVSDLLRAGPDGSLLDDESGVDLNEINGPRPATRQPKGSVFGGPFVSPGEKRKRAKESEEQKQAAEQELVSDLEALGFSKMNKKAKQGGKIWLKVDPATNVRWMVQKIEDRNSPAVTIRVVGSGDDEGKNFGVGKTLADALVDYHERPMDPGLEIQNWRRFIGV